LQGLRLVIGGASRGTLLSPSLRVGIINIMPRAETYERYILRPLARSTLLVEPVWIRLRTHRYASSDSEHIGCDYVEYEAAIRTRPLDGLILTGAPVEELDFPAVHYWDEAKSRAHSAFAGADSLSPSCSVSKSDLSRTSFSGCFDIRTSPPIKVS
jgi:hypothetical protein